MILLLFIFSLGTKKMIDIVNIFFLVTDLGWHKHMRKRKRYVVLNLLMTDLFAREREGVRKKEEGENVWDM